MIKTAICLTLLLFVATSSFATTFIVREDAEIIATSEAIVHGIVTGSLVDEEGKYVRTIYDLRVLRVLKGELTPGQVIQVSSPGGAGTKRLTHVAAAAHFEIGEEVVLLLGRHRGDWVPSDMALSKFAFAVSESGESLLVRDSEEIVGWDGKGETYVERVREESAFLNYIGEVVAGRRPEPDYFVDERPLIPSRRAQANSTIAPNAAFPAHTYSVSFFQVNGTTCALTRTPGRFQTATMNAGINFKKSTTQDPAGVPDGGVGLITNAAAAWTNHSGSTANVTFGGTTPIGVLATSDGTNIVLFNDPAGDIFGTFGVETSVVATAFTGASGIHDHEGTTWFSISGSDIIFNNGYSVASASAPTVMTHEMGHSLGLRHADRAFGRAITPDPDGVAPCTGSISGSESACDAGSMECANTAIMTATANSALNGNLQTWDGNAIGALYPATGTPPAPPTNMAIFASSASGVSLSWSGSDGATSYNVYRRSGPGAYSFIGTPAPPAATSYIDPTASGTAYQYVVRAVNANGESGDSNSDFTTAITFTDTMSSGLTVKLVHFNELLTAVNALRGLTGTLSPFSFSAPAPAGGVTVRKSHVDGLRTALNEARTALGGSTVTFSESLVAGSTNIKALHLTELRNGVY